MADILSLPTPQTDAEYEDAFAAMMNEIQYLRGMMAADQKEIERLRAESQQIREETQALKAKTRAIIADLKVRAAL